MCREYMYGDVSKLSCTAVRNFTLSDTSMRLLHFGFLLIAKPSTRLDAIDKNKDYEINKCCSEANLRGTKEARAKTSWFGVGILCPNAEVGLSLGYSFRELSNINLQLSLLIHSGR